MKFSINYLHGLQIWVSDEKEQPRNSKQKAYGKVYKKSLETAFLFIFSLWLSTTYNMRKKNRQRFMCFIMWENFESHENNCSLAYLCVDILQLRRKEIVIWFSFWQFSIFIFAIRFPGLSAGCYNLNWMGSVYLYSH